MNASFVVSYPLFQRARFKRRRKGPLTGAESPPKVEKDAV